jgi:hypothetical protein
MDYPGTQVFSRAGSDGRRRGYSKIILKEADEVERDSARLTRVTFVGKVQQTRGLVAREAPGALGKVPSFGSRDFDFGGVPSLNLGGFNGSSASSASPARPAPQKTVGGAGLRARASNNALQGGSSSQRNLAIQPSKYTDAGGASTQRNLGNQSLPSLTLGDLNLGGQSLPSLTGSHLAGKFVSEKARGKTVRPGHAAHAKGEAQFPKMVLVLKDEERDRNRGVLPSQIIFPSNALSMRQGERRTVDATVLQPWDDTIKDVKLDFKDVMAARSKANACVNRSSHGAVTYRY